MGVFSHSISTLSDYDKPSNLGVIITKRGNAQVLAGSQMRYDITVELPRCLHQYPVWGRVGTGPSLRTW